MSNAGKLTKEVKEFALEHGARMVGIASGTRLQEGLPGHRPEDFLPRARNVVMV